MLIAGFLAIYYPPNSRKDHAQLRRCVRLLMAQRSYYQILEVDRTATLEEIRLAFKKRALQVHPDKGDGSGGSKEAFHQVYEALETLADPVARQSYDRGQGALKPGTADLRAPRRRPKATGRSKEPETKKAPTTHQPRAPGTPGRPGTPGPKPSGPSAETQQSKETKLLTKIRDLLKCLPRDMRNDVITKHFSQKQRLILEKWMADASSSEPKVPHVLSDAGNVTDKRPVQPDGAKERTVQLALPARSETRRGQLGQRWAAGKRRVRQKNLTEPNKKPRRVRGMGTVCKQNSGSYRACIWMNAVLHMYAKNCDLQTALEFLVILTTTKQRVQNQADVNMTFEESLEEALVSSAREQGRSLAELGLRFVVGISAGFFVAPGFVVRSPAVSSIEQFVKVRGILEPFRQYGIHSRGRSGRLFWRYSPAHLHTAWQEFQSAVASAWEAAGSDGAVYLQKIRALNEARAPSRAKNMEEWEREHMVLNDKKKHRPRRFRDSIGKCRHPLQQWERKHMAMNDRNKHRPASWRVPAQQRTPDEALETLKRILARWGIALNREKRSAENARRSVLRKQKKIQQDRRRLEAREKKRRREEEQMRRESLRKRMRSEVTMDDIFGAGADNVRSPHEKKPKLTRCRCCPFRTFFKHHCS
eukprot:Skav201668  [mRNA]  locus=scaffold641:318108:320303:+ [translate_table: standard]